MMDKEAVFVNRSLGNQSVKIKRVDVRPAHFNTVLISLIKRTLYKDIEKYSKFKAKIVICF